MEPGDPVALYTTTLTPTVAQLETEFTTNWRPYVLAEQAPYLFSEVLFTAFTNPSILKLYLRDRLGKWSLTPDGSISVTALDPTDGAWSGRHFIGNGCSGFVWASDHAGTAITTRSTVGV